MSVPGAGRTVPLAEAHFGAADSRGQHGHGLAPTAASASATGHRDPYTGQPGEATGSSSHVPQLLAGQAEDVTLLLSDTVFLWTFSGQNLLLSPQVTRLGARPETHVVADATAEWR